MRRKPVALSFATCDQVESRQRARSRKGILWNVPHCSIVQHGAMTTGILMPGHSGCARAGRQAMRRPVRGHLRVWPLTMAGTCPRGASDRTEVRVERARSALTYNRSPDLPFDRSINPYRGCEHGCIYCFARPSHAFLNLSPGLDFETRLIARPGIGAVLDARTAGAVLPGGADGHRHQHRPLSADRGVSMA
jgi:hypothetical protein